MFSYLTNLFSPTNRKTSNNQNNMKFESRNRLNSPFRQQQSQSSNHSHHSPRKSQSQQHNLTQRTNKSSHSTTSYPSRSTRQSTHHSRSPSSSNEEDDDDNSSVTQINEQSDEGDRDYDIPKQLSSPPKFNRLKLRNSNNQSAQDKNASSSNRKSQQQPVSPKSSRSLSSSNSSSPTLSSNSLSSKRTPLLVAVNANLSSSAQRTCPSPNKKSPTTQSASKPVYSPDLVFKQTDKSVKALRQIQREEEEQRRNGEIEARNTQLKPKQFSAVTPQRSPKPLSRVIIDFDDDFEPQLPPRASQNRQVNNSSTKSKQKSRRVESDESEYDDEMQRREEKKDSRKQVKPPSNKQTKHTPLSNRKSGRMEDESESESEYMDDEESESSDGDFEDERKKNRRRSNKQQINRRPSQRTTPSVNRKRKRDSDSEDAEYIESEDNEDDEEYIEERKDNKRSYKQTRSASKKQVKEEEDDEESDYTPMPTASARKGATRLSATVQAKRPAKGKQKTNTVIKHESVKQEIVSSSKRTRASTASSPSSKSSTTSNPFVPRTFSPLPPRNVHLFTFANYRKTIKPSAALSFKQKFEHKYCSTQQSLTKQLVVTQITEDKIRLKKLLRPLVIYERESQALKRDSNRRSRNKEVDVITSLNYPCSTLPITTFYHQPLSHQMITLHQPSNILTLPAHSALPIHFYSLSIDRTDSTFSLQKQCASFLSYLFSSSISSLFLLPYHMTPQLLSLDYTIVTQPLSLYDIDLRVIHGYYRCLEEFCSDLKLLWKNMQHLLPRKITDQQQDNVKQQENPLYKQAEKWWKLVEDGIKHGKLGKVDKSILEYLFDQSSVLHCISSFIRPTSSSSSSNSSPPTLPSSVARKLARRVGVKPADWPEDWLNNCAS